MRIPKTFNMFGTLTLMLFKKIDDNLPFSSMISEIMTHTFLKIKTEISFILIDYRKLSKIVYILLYLSFCVYVT